MPLEELVLQAKVHCVIMSYRTLISNDLARVPNR